MAFDYSKLRGRIVEKFATQANFAAAMHLSEHSLSLKLNSRVEWKQGEIRRACELLGISESDIAQYFFAPQVQY